MKKVLSGALAVVLTITLLTAHYAFATNGKNAVTGTLIIGIDSAITASADKDLKRVINVSPANGGRTVYLQIYLSDTNEYKTVGTYKTADASHAKVKITFPKKWRKRRTGKWRIVVLKSKKASRAVKRITVTTRNIVHKTLFSKAACVYCIEDNAVVYGQSLHKHLKQASTTKIMTAILFLESGKIDDKTVISKKASETPYSKPYMLAGDEYTNRSLFYALMLPSSNGAAVALAETVSGSEKRFVADMNKKAEELGLKDTHYVTPHGLDEKGHYSSAYDVTLEMAYIYPRSPNFRKVIAAKDYTSTSLRQHIKFYIKSTDEMKDYSKKHKGGKTGFTSGAGCCFASVYVHNGKTYCVTVLGADKSEKRWKDVRKLYKYIDNHADTKY